MEARDRIKSLRDDETPEELKEITDLLLATAGSKAIRQTSLMSYPAEIENLTFKKFKEIILRYIQRMKSLIVAERS